MRIDFSDLWGEKKDMAIFLLIVQNRKCLGMQKCKSSQWCVWYVLCVFCFLHISSTATEYCCVTASPHSTAGGPSGFKSASYEPPDLKVTLNFQKIHRSTENHSMYLYVCVPI